MSTRKRDQVIRTLDELLGRREPVANLGAGRIDVRLGGQSVRINLPPSAGSARNVQAR
jgi:hypothetical protein